MHPTAIFSDTWILPIKYCPWKKRFRGDRCSKILLTNALNDTVRECHKISKFFA